MTTIPQLTLVQHLIAMLSILEKRLGQTNNGHAIHLSPAEQSQLGQFFAPQINNLLNNVTDLSTDEISAILEAVILLANSVNHSAVYLLVVEPAQADLRLQALCACTCYPQYLPALQQAIKTVHPDTVFTESEMISNSGSAIINHYDTALVRIHSTISQYH